MGGQGSGSRTYLGEGHVGDDDHVQCRRSILLGGSVTTGVVLVLALAATLLPGLAVGCLGHASLGRSAGGRSGWDCEQRPGIRKHGLDVCGRKRSYRSAIRQQQRCRP